jgi:hypothetical protein
MTSFVFDSSVNGCPACVNSRAGIAHFPAPRVLRTGTEDLCAECGKVLQQFPKVKKVEYELDAGVVQIPEPVSSMVATLLKRRLFHFEAGGYPGLTDTFGRLMAPGWRQQPSGQALIAMTGAGNVWAKVTWSYVTAEEYRVSRLDKFSHPRKFPTLESVKVPMPAPIRRALDIVTESEFNLTDRFVSNYIWTLRFDKAFPLEQQPFDLVKRCLLVKLELSFLKIGESFPSGDGARDYYVGERSNNRYERLTLEEAFERALVAASRGDWAYANEIHKHGANSYRCSQLQIDRLLLKEQCGPRPIVTNPASRAWLYFDLNKHDCDPRNTWLPSGGRDVLPPGVEFLGVNLRESSLVSLELNGAIVWKQNIEVVASNSSFRSGQRFDITKVLNDKLGGVVIRIKNDNEDLTFEYELVSTSEHQRVCDRIVERYKLRTLYEVREKFAADSNKILSPQQKIAAYIGGRWLEGLYLGDIAITELDKPPVYYMHRVEIVQENGIAEWKVFDVMPLEQALYEGLSVIPPFDRRVELLSAKLIGVRPVV